MAGHIRRVFVGGLASTVRERDLQDLMYKYKPEAITVTPKGFGFVDFPTPADAEDAVYKFHHQQLHGVRINVELAKSNPRGDAPTGGGGAPQQQQQQQQYQPPSSSAAAPAPSHHAAPGPPSTSSYRSGERSGAPGGSSIEFRVPPTLSRTRRAVLDGLRGNDVTPQEVADFFAGHGFVVNYVGCHLKRDGQALVEFADPDEVPRAIALADYAALGSGVRMQEDKGPQARKGMRRDIPPPAQAMDVSA